MSDDSKPKQNPLIDSPARRKVLKGASTAGLFALLGPRWVGAQQQEEGKMIDMILMNGRITTLDRTNPEVEAIAIGRGLVVATGLTKEIMRLATDKTQVIDLAGKRVIPGLNDSHTHLIRGGLNYNMELRWACPRYRTHFAC